METLPLRNGPATTKFSAGRVQPFVAENDGRLDSLLNRRDRMQKLTAFYSQVERALGRRETTRKSGRL
jgi:hypothetical protein